MTSTDTAADAGPNGGQAINGREARALLATRRASRSFSTRGPA